MTAQWQSTSIAATSALTGRAAASRKLLDRIGPRQSGRAALLPFTNDGQTIIPLLSDLRRERVNL